MEPCGDRHKKSSFKGKRESSGGAEQPSDSTPADQAALGSGDRGIAEGSSQSLSGSPAASEAVPLESGMRPLGLPERRLDHLTIPQFSKILSRYHLNMVIGIPAINNHLVELFLRTAFPNDFKESLAKDVSAKIGQRLSASVTADELHLNHPTTLPLPNIDIGAPVHERDRFVTLSGEARGADFVAVISDHVAIRLPVRGGRLNGIFPLRGPIGASVIAYSLKSENRTKSGMVSLKIESQASHPVPLPAFDLLGVLDRVVQGSLSQSLPALVEELKTLATVELRQGGRLDETLRYAARLSFLSGTQWLVVQQAQQH